MTPLTYQWNGEAMVPLSRFHNVANAELVVGQNYVLTEVEDRSQKSHAHLFVEIGEVWSSLPEDLANQYPTPEHLRKTALIRAGFCTVQDHVCKSDAEALRTAILAKSLDQYAITETRGNVLRIYRAQSMAWGRMKRADFQAAKDGVFRVILELTGINPADAEARAA